MNIRPFFVLVLFIQLSFTSFGQIQSTAESRRCIEEIQELIHSDSKTSFQLMEKKYPVNKINGKHFLSMIGSFTDNFNPASLPEGIIMGSKTGRIATLRIPIDELEKINDIQNLEYIEISPKIAPELRKAIQDTRVDSLHSGINLPSSYTGKNVIIGITDWGFDYTHPMFYDSSLNKTRILASWDQARTSGPSPSNFGYGTEIVGENDLLHFESDTSTSFYSYATHGSHVAGISGGGGAGIGLFGMAPSSEFLFSQLFLDAASAIDAVAWMKNYAEKEEKRLVVNMSWGLYQLGPLDGTSVISEAFDSYVDDGVVIVTSNGNNGSTDLHIKKQFNNDTITSRIGMVVSSNPNSWGQNVIMWGDKNNTFSAGFDVYQSGNIVGSSPYFSTSTMTGYVDSNLVIGNDTIIYKITQDSIHPRNQCPHMSMKIRNRYSKYAIVLKSTSANAVVHYLNIAHNLDHVANWGYDFTSYGPHGVDGNSEYTVGEPSCAKNVISVGSHISEIRLPFDTIHGNISPFSSRGPTIDGRMKPDVCAPGSSVLSSISSFTDENYTPAENTTFKGKKYDFARFSGTSMAGPMVTGIVALILEARQFATPSQVKDIIRSTAREDDKTGSIPSTGSTTWGWGKVTATAAVRKAMDEVLVEEFSNSSQIKLYPNPASTIINISFYGLSSIAQVFIYDVHGKSILNKEITLNSTIDISEFPSGIYFIHISNQNLNQHIKFIVK